MFDFTPSTPCPVQQHPNFVAALRACGQRPLVTAPPYSAVVLRRRLSRGLPLAMLVRSNLTVRLGPSDTFLDWLIDAGLGRSPIILSPDTPCAERLTDLGALPLATPSTVAEIDLTLDDDHRRARMHQKWRNRLTRAETQNRLRIVRRTRPLEPDHWLFQADRALQRQRGFRNWPEALTVAYGRENPKQTVLFTAYDGREPVAAMLFLRHGTGVTYHIGHSSAAGRQLSAHTVLLWNASCWFAAQGHHRLDLGLVDTQNAAGLARFKLGSGARPRSLGGTWLWWPPLGAGLRFLSALDRRSMRGMPV